MKSSFVVKIIALLIFFSLGVIHAQAQMRQLFKSTDENETFESVHFISGSEGFITTLDYVGYTTDSGRTFTKKFITAANTDPNGAALNPLVSMRINGVYAFDRNNFIVYGHYNFIPAIVETQNGGANFKLVHYTTSNFSTALRGVADMVFPGNGSIGYAVQSNGVYKTSNKGASWTLINASPALCDQIDAIDANNLIVGSKLTTFTKMWKTQNGGSSWSAINIPAKVQYLNGFHFRTATEGWVSGSDDFDDAIYKTTNGGSTWTPVNDPVFLPFIAVKMKFFSSTLGYAMSEDYYMYKTTDGGATWDPLSRDNNFTYLGYRFEDVFFLNDQQFWGVGGYGLTEMTTNGGGTVLPKARFVLDTASMRYGRPVILINKSAPGASYQWFVDGRLISTSYNASYQKIWDDHYDVIRLVTNFGSYSDTMQRAVEFPPGPRIQDFFPKSGGEGTRVKIFGSYTWDVNRISFGGVPAGFGRSGDTLVATVGKGASGAVYIASNIGWDTLPGFKFIYPPEIRTVSPLKALAGETITIRGRYFTGIDSLFIAGIMVTNYTITSDSTIECVVPSSGEGTIEIVSRIGGRGSFTGFAAIPVIQRFTPMQGTEGTVLNIYGQSLLGLKQISVGGMKVDTFRTISAGEIEAIVGSGNTGDVVVQNSLSTISRSLFTWYNPPVISSFSPSSAHPGDIITISGNHFQIPAQNNSVFFGPAKAEIVDGSATTLRVRVPEEAAHDQITVISNLLVTVSSSRFNKTLPGNNIASAGSFSEAAKLKGLPVMSLGDFDGDGKPDIVTTSSYQNEEMPQPLTAYRNISVAGANPAFEEKDLGQFKGKIVGIPVDLDNDGKLDIVTDYLTRGFGVMRNTSTPGNISFDSSFFVYRGLPGNFYESMKFLSTADVDGDGKTDLIYTKAGPDAGDLILYRNQSDPGLIRMAPAEVIATDMYRTILAYLDGDDKIDILEWTDDAVTPYFNRSRKGKPSFEKGTCNTPPLFSRYITTADVDTDGREELIMQTFNATEQTVYRKKITGTLMELTPEVSNHAIEARQIRLFGDLDGDGLPESVTGVLPSRLVFHRNLSKKGATAYSDPILANNDAGVNVRFIMDMNNDGKNDIIITENDSFRIVLNTARPQPFVREFSPRNGSEGTTITLRGTNFSGTTEVKFGTATAQSFTVQSDSLITAIVGKGTSGSISAKNSYGLGEKSGFVFGVAPVIYSVSPLAASPGKNITLTGERFSTLPSNNIVVIGGTRAEVLSSSAGSMVVKLPYGAKTDPITITNAELSASFYGEFNTTTPVPGSGFTDSSFLPEKSVPDSLIRGEYADIDGDGKLDFVSIFYGPLKVSLNTSDTANIRFAAPVTTGREFKFDGLAIGDLDGDGWKDVVTKDNRFLTIWKNKSTKGQVRFEKVKTLVGADLGEIKIADMDLDGLQDIIAGSYYSVGVYRNNSGGGQINFEERIDMLSSGEYQGFRLFKLADLNADKLPDLVSFDFGVRAVLNLSKPGTIKYGKAQSFPTPNDRLIARDMAVADIDTDGKTDLVVALDSLYIWLNKSSGNTLDFTRVSYPKTYTFTSFIEAADLDGDGKRDLAVQVDGETYSGDNSDKKGILLYANQSSPGRVNFQAPVLIKNPPAFAGFYTAADLNNDGYTDLTSLRFYWQNSGKLSSLVNLCTAKDTVLTTAATSGTYQWQINRGTGYVNLTEAAPFSGTRTGSLRISRPDTTYNNALLRVMLDNNQPGKEYSLKVTQSRLAQLRIDTIPGDACAGTPITLKAYLTNGTATRYQWFRNGTLAGSGPATISFGSLSAGDSIWAVAEISTLCATSDQVTSNKVVAHFNSGSVKVSIKGDTLIDSNLGNAVTAEVSNPLGSNLEYVWLDSTATHDWQPIVGAGQSNRFIYYAEQSGDAVRLMLISENRCGGKDTLYSNTLRFRERNQFPDPVLYPNPATDELVISGLKQDEEWSTLLIFSSYGTLLYEKSIKGLTEIRVSLTGWRAGIYTAVLSRGTGPDKIIRFMKL